MSDVDFDVLKERLLLLMEQNDVESVLFLLKKLKEMVAEDLEVAKKMSDPTVIDAFHNALVEHVGVKPNSLKLKNRESSRQRRAYLLAQAMYNGVLKTTNG